MSTTISAPREPLRHNEPLSGKTSLIGEPLLLPGEDRAAYDQLLADLTDAVRPSDRLEDLWVTEAVAKHWEVLRHRRHKRRMRHRLMVQQLEPPILIPTTSRAARQHVRDLIELDERWSQDLYIPWRLRTAGRMPEGAEKFALAIANLARRLATLERYERRTMSRRKRAFRKLVAEQRKLKGNL